MPRVLFESLPPSPSIKKPRLLVCTPQNASPVLGSLRQSPSYTSELIPLSHYVPSRVRFLLALSDIVLLDVTTSSRDILKNIRELAAVIGICNPRPRVLCFSTAHRNPEFVLKIQKCGACYARIGNSEMLREAIDLLLAEMRELECNGPHFEIIHCFSNGICAPGEEISGVLHEHRGEYVQLPLGLAERLVFDLLAQRRLAVDSLQIVSGLADWFYKEHAANSRHKQGKKIRRPTVKVLIQRIRDAMARTFGRARLPFDPYQVLRSCPAEGTNRVLYKLHANVSWRHIR